MFELVRFLIQLVQEFWSNCRDKNLQEAEASSMPRLADFILVSPRLSSDEGAHFLPYFLNILPELISRYDNVFVIAPDSFKFPENTSRFLEENAVNVIPLPSTQSWGNDIGFVNPLWFSRYLLKRFPRYHRSQIHLFANESSLAILLMTCSLIFLNPRITATINLIDFGFWNKFITQRGIKRFAAMSYIALFQRLSARLKIVAQSPELVNNLKSKGLNSVRLWPFIQLTPKNFSISNFRLVSREESNPLRKTLLVLPWPEDHKTVGEVVELLKRDSGETVDIIVHTKSVEEMSRLREAHGLDGRISFSGGSLEPMAYHRMLFNSSLVWLPYFSKSHAETGSGRALDALLAGVPVLLDKNSVMHETHGRLAPGFLIPTVSQSADALKNQILEILSMEKNEEDKENTSYLILNSFSAKSMIDEIESGSGSITKSNMLKFDFVMNFVLCYTLHRLFCVATTFRNASKIKKR